jgi:hypothetical protein
MTEVEPFRLMYRVTNPFREVSIAYLTDLLAVLIFDKLLQIIIVDILILTEVSKDILYSDVTIIISIQSKEGFTDTFPIVGELVFQYFL